MIRVRELKTNGIFPKSFLDILPTECTYCGSALDITETLTAIRCSNERCIEKAIQRLSLMLKDLGVNLLDIEQCRLFLRKHKTFNPYSILMYNPDTDGVLYDGCDMSFSYKVYDELNKVRDMLLSNYVSIGNINGLKEVSWLLFKGYSSIDAFYSDLYEEGISLVQKLLGLELDDTVSVKALNIYNTLIDYERELKQSIVGVNIQIVDIPILNICLSSVGKPYKNKVEFVEEMAAICDGKIHLNILKGVTKDCDYLINSTVGNITSKISKAIKYNIPIITGIEFEEYLKTRC